MRIDTAVPLSRFKAQPFEEHPPGSIIVIAPWQSKPAKLCLAVKMSGLVDGQAEVGAAFVLQGTPYSDGKECVGEVLRNIEHGSRILEKPLLGLSCPTRVEVEHDALADQSQQRNWRSARGCLAIGPFGTRICGGSGESIYSWATPIALPDWSADQSALNKSIDALLADWTLVLDLDAAHEVRIPVHSSAFVTNGN